jgi:uncharacterized membrane protein YbaN (DUF454 family)
VCVASRDSDRLRRRLALMRDYRWFGVFFVHWDLGNSIAEQCKQSAELLMSFVIGLFVLLRFGPSKRIAAHRMGCS